jgi:hypothetical protein
VAPVGGGSSGGRLGVRAATPGGGGGGGRLRARAVVPGGGGDGGDDDVRAFRNETEEGRKKERRRCRSPSIFVGTTNRLGPCHVGLVVYIVG